MRQLEKLLIIALNEQAVNTVVEIMHTLCADFIEGENDIAGELFNKYFCKLYPEMQRKYIHTSPFEHHANKSQILLERTALYVGNKGRTTKPVR